MKNKILKLLSLTLIIFSLFAFTACDKGDDLWQDAIYKTDAVVGEGSREFILNVSAGEKTVTLTVRTDKEMLGDALLELGLIEGEVAEYGLYVKRVNGITADYDVDKHYWALYINGDYAMAGVDATEISEGVQYTLERAK